MYLLRTCRRLLGTFVPFFTSEPNDRRAAIACSIAFCAFVLVAVTVVVALKGQW